MGYQRWSQQLSPILQCKSRSRVPYRSWHYKQLQCLHNLQTDWCDISQPALHFASTSCNSTNRILITWLHWPVSSKLGYFLVQFQLQTNSASILEHLIESFPVTNFLLSISYPFDQWKYRDCQREPPTLTRRFFSCRGNQHFQLWNLILVELFPEKQASQQHWNILPRQHNLQRESLWLDHRFYPK
jgi:hypothetical protein